MKAKAEPCSVKEIWLVGSVLSDAGAFSEAAGELSGKKLNLKTLLLRDQRGSSAAAGVELFDSALISVE